MVQPPKETKTFSGLLQLVEALRGPQGCPWDKEQTHRTLTPFVIEEAHELAEAIEAGSESEIIDELGDVLLQVVLHAEIARGEGRFDITHVIDNLNQKMIRRHPHVFGEVNASSSEQVLENWAKIKEAEKAEKSSASNTATSQTATQPPPLIEVPVHLPALMRAQKIGAKTKKLRFDWPNIEGVWKKVEEELNELQGTLLEAASPQEREHELGDVLFSLAQLARHMDLDAEQSLRVANQRFLHRFSKMNQMIVEDGLIYSNLAPVELETYWEKAKAWERAHGGHSAAFSQ